MKWRTILFSSLATILFLSFVAGCSKTDDEKPATPKETNEAPAKTGVTVDTGILGLKIESPATFAWQPEIKGFGRVIVPATLAAAMADVEATRSVATVSAKELERQQTLLAQNNTSLRALETAKATAQHDALASSAALEKFKLDWGSAFADSGDREQTMSNIISGTVRLVRMDLPAGETLLTTPTSARVLAMANETNAATAEFFGATDAIDEQTQSRSFFFLTTNQSLLPGEAVTGYLKIPGEPVNGVIVPASAVLRHEGVGWVYVQTETNQFVRTEIPLDRLTADGWFVTDNLSATNRIVVAGAQAVLSAELSGGGFNTGERD